MKTSTTQAWTAALAVMSMRGHFTIAEAVPAALQKNKDTSKPRYYYPKHIKRQWPNLTAIVSGLPHSHSTEHSSSSDSGSVDPQRVESSDDSGLFFSALAALTGEAPVSSSSSTSSTSTTMPANTTSISYSSTSTSTTSSLTTSESIPTPSSKPGADYPDAPTTSSSSTAGGLLGGGGPLGTGTGGLLGPLLNPTPTSSSSSSMSTTSTTTPTETGTGSGGYPHLNEPTPTPAGPPPGDDNRTNATSSETSTSSEPIIFVGLSTTFTSTLPSSTSSSSSEITPLVSLGLGGILPPSPTSTSTGNDTGIIPGLLPPSTSEPTSSTSEAAPEPQITPGPNATDVTTSIVASSALSTNGTGLLGLPIPIPTLTTSGLESTDTVLPTLTSGLSSILSGITPTASVTDTATTSGSSTTSGSDTTLIPIPLPTGSTTSTTATDNSSIISTSFSFSTSIALPTDTSSSSTDISQTTSATDVISSTSSVAVVPTGSSNFTSATATLTTAPSTTDVPVATTTTSDTSASATSASDTAPSTTSTTSAPIFSIVPTATNTETTMSIPTSLVFAPTSTGPTTTVSGTEVPIDSSTSSASSGLPTAMPRLVQPPGGMPQPPIDKTLIQIGFLYGLNYNFVVGTENSANQIFTYLPQGIAFALGIGRDQVIMNGLMPYDTTKTLNYVTTLAQAYIPSDLVNQLQLDLHNPISKAYNNPDDAVRMLMSMVNPTMSILPGQNKDSNAGTSNAYGPEDGSSNAQNNGSPISDDTGSSSKVKRTSVGISVGAVMGAAVYAAAMVYVARRYRNKKKSHKRASSIGTHGEMSQRSPGTPGTLTGGMGSYFMSGGNGHRGSGTSRGSLSRGSGSGRGSRNSAGSSSNNRSVREQGISAPIMAENSLGWS